LFGIQKNKEVRHQEIGVKRIDMVVLSTWCHFFHESLFEGTDKLGVLGMEQCEDW
jgi:hypothetical protein